MRVASDSVFIPAMFLDDLTCYSPSIAQWFLSMVASGIAILAAVIAALPLRGQNFGRISSQQTSRGTIGLELSCGVMDGGLRWYGSASYAHQWTLMRRQR